LKHDRSDAIGTAGEVKPFVVHTTRFDVPPVMLLPPIKVLGLVRDVSSGFWSRVVQRPR